MRLNDDAKRHGLDAPDHDMQNRASQVLTLEAELKASTEIQQKRQLSVLKDRSVDRAVRAAGLAAEDRFESFATTISGLPLVDLASKYAFWFKGETESRLRGSLANRVQRISSGRFFVDPNTTIESFESHLQIVHDWVIQQLTKYCVPANPVLRWLRLRAESNLQKIRTGRNLAGLKRELESYSTSNGATMSLPTISRDGQLVLTGVGGIKPTAYRYAVLIERAKELVRLAMQFESAMLDALKNQDDLEYQQLRARQDIRLAQAGVRLQDLKLTAASSEVKLAQFGLNRANVQVRHLSQLIEEGISAPESNALFWLEQAADWQDTAARNTMIAAGLSGISTSFNAGGPLSMQASAFSEKATSWATTASMLLTQASFERREQEWEFQQSLALEDMRIASQQIVLAENQLAIAGFERTILGIQLDNAESVLTFLTNKFLNAELYQWMAGVLQNVYRYFLQEAASVARLSSTQLAFERQEQAPPFIKSDYWRSTQTAFGDSSKGEDRKGLTGSARLTQDIYQLDQYAFETNKRKLQMTRPISLSRLDPLAFSKFRDSGVLPFRLPMELFDRDFPGHYLRLIKRIRVSTVALLPISEGIRATLSSSGPSRAVIGGQDGFQTVIIRRPPESVSFTSPINATGLFDLDAQPELLVPFEGMGVDSSWQFELSKASNPFDFSSLADVIITIDYTALNSSDYRTQVITSLGRTTSFDVLLSFRSQFADAWYTLHNPENPAKPRIVAMRTERSDFPPNLKDLRIEQVSFLINSDQAELLGGERLSLEFREHSSTSFVGGETATMRGLASTRRSAASWLSMIGRQPIGEWRLAIPQESSEVYFDRQIATDFVIVLSCSAENPPFPQ